MSNDGAATTASGDGRARGTRLAKIGKANQRGMTTLHSHPETKRRIAAIARIAGARPHQPFLPAADWATLQQICTR